jgi:hypothetical protein
MEHATEPERWGRYVDGMWIKIADFQNVWTTHEGDTHSWNVRASLLSSPSASIKNITSSSDLIRVGPTPKREVHREFLGLTICSPFRTRFNNPLHISISKYLRRQGDVARKEVSEYRNR